MNKARILALAGIKVGMAVLLAVIVYIVFMFIAMESDPGRWSWAARLAFVVFELAAILWPWSVAERQIKKTKGATDGK